MEQKILRTKFLPRRPALLSARATLFADRIEFRGWGLRGRFSADIRVAQIENVEWWTSLPRTPNFRMVLADGSAHAFWLENAGIWRFELARLLGEKVSDDPLPATLGGVRSAA